MQRGLCVLICARDELASHRLGRQLTGMGVHYQWARTAQAAISLMALAQFDALAIDLILPDQDGISLIQRLRNSGCKIPVVGLSLRSSIKPASTNLHAAVKLAGTDAAADRARAIFAVKVATQRMEGYHPRILELSPDKQNSQLAENTLGKQTDLIATNNLEEAKELMGKKSFDLALVDPEFLEDDKSLEDFAGANPCLPLILHSIYHATSNQGTCIANLLNLARIIRIYAMFGHEDSLQAHA